MNKLLILPGFHVKNLTWAEETAKQLQPQFEFTIYEWKHWKTGNNADFSLEGEAKNILTQVKEMDGEVSVIAKSIGTWVLARTYREEPQLFNKIILCGVPLNDLEKEEWNEYKSFHNLRVGRVICFQNSNDKHGTYTQVSNFFEDSKLDIKIIKKPGDTHDYPYFEDFRTFLLKS